MTGVPLILALAGALSFGEVDLNRGWTRTVGAEKRSVDLPDDFNINRPWVESAGGNRAFKAAADGVYRKTFTPDPQWRGKRIYLELDGVQAFCDVLLNGSPVATWEYGSLAFETELTDRIDWSGANEIEVRCGTGGSAGCRWYTGCGITRGAKLILREKTAFVRHGLSVVTPDVSAERAVVRVTAETSGPSAEIVVRILSPQGAEVGRTTAAAREDGAPVVLPDVNLKAPELWDIASPRQYGIVAELIRDGKVLDRVERRFGVRRIEFSNAFGFRLNGRKVFLKGAVGHQHLGALGEASFRRAWKRQLEVLREFGFNAVRCAHNPYPEEFLDLCDEMGVLVVDELVDKWKGWWPGRSPFMELAPRFVEEWVRRDRNHPSVILWSVGNETQFSRNLPFADGQHGIGEYRHLDGLVKRWDRTRPTTVAMFPARAGEVTRRDPGFWENPVPPELSRVTEVASYNYVPGDYAAYRRQFPHLVVFQSEAAVNALTRAFYLMDYDSMVGLCYWGAIEYWGESDGWPKKGWDYSFFRRTLEPHPQAWLVRSAFRSVDEEPVVRIGVETGEAVRKHWNDVEVGSLRLVSDWTFPEGKDRRVLVFSNGNETELFLNGKSLGVRRNEVGDPERRNIMEWKAVPFAPGCLEAVARRRGNVVARHRIETAGSPVGIEVECENAADWLSDGADLQYVRVRAVDAAGRTVRGATGSVSFAVTGAATLVAVDNGDSCTGARFDVDTVQFHHGTVQAILRSTRSAGDVVLTVDAGRLGVRRVELATANH